MKLPSLAEIEAASETVYSAMPPTPQYAWRLLSQRAGCTVWVKHENHSPVGAFKVRGGLVYMKELAERHPDVPGVVTATRGNHGQSIGFAARQLGLKAIILVPHGNSIEKNAAMEAQGVDLQVHGSDFQEAREHCQELSEAHGYHMIEPFLEGLVRGVATYPMEFFKAVPDLDSVYVPIGQGSGICATVAARDALALKTKIVGVVAEDAPAYKLSFDAGRAVSSNRSQTIADGMACRVPDPEAVEIICRGVERVVTVSEEEIRAAMRIYYSDTHNLAEGAGAAPLAALLKEKEAMAGRNVGLMLTGGNVDAAVFREVLVEA